MPPKPTSKANEAATKQGGKGTGFVIYRDNKEDTKNKSKIERIHCETQTDLGWNHKEKKTELGRKGGRFAEREREKVSLTKSFLLSEYYDRVCESRLLLSSLRGQFDLLEEERNRLVLENKEIKVKCIQWSE